MSNKVNRRDFLKIGGISTGVALGSALVKPIKKASALTSSDFKYRDRSNRYPWWVKTVDKPTNEFDLDSMTQYKFTNNVIAAELNMGKGVEVEIPNYSLPKYIGADKFIEIQQKNKKIVKEHIQNNVPGYNLRDKALIDAMYTYFDPSGARTGGDLSAHVTTPEDFGVSRWEGTEEEASDMIEAAAKLFGTQEIGFCALEPKFLYDHVEVSSSVDQVTQKEGKMLIPERFKYVITLGCAMPLETVKRAPTHIGGAGELVAYKNVTQAKNMVKNFIKGIGYETISLPGVDVPFAIMSGMGELGRINRCINPIYGANLRLSVIITDLPLTLDKPIDFGLQDFCKGCKICANACPSGAISMDDGPSEAKYAWNQEGKKAYNEDGTKCRSYMVEHGSRCCVCTVSCPWSRPIGSALHDISGPIGAKMPFAAGLLADMHDVFGYGLENDAESQSEWWNLDLPSYGFEKFEGK